MVDPSDQALVDSLRLLIPDKEPMLNPARPADPPTTMFTDDELVVYLEINAMSIRLAAADCCEVIGTSEALIAKVIQTEDLKTDGAKVMQQFLARARQLRSRAAAAGEDQLADGDLYVVPGPTPYQVLC